MLLLTAAWPLSQPLVDFLRAPDHRMDFNAIRVNDSHGQQISHLPRDVAAAVRSIPAAQMLLAFRNPFFAGVRS